MEKLMEELKKEISNLNEAVATKFSSANPKQTEAEKDALVANVLELQKQVKEMQAAKTIRKMVWSVNGAKSADEGVDSVPFNKFLKAVADKDHAFLAQMKAPSGQSEGTAADGGNAVPVEYANQIVALERQSSIVRRLAKVFPMGSLTRKIPRELAKPTVSWVGEGVEPTLTKGTLDQLTQTAKKLIAIVPFSEELLEDNNVSYDSFIAEIVATEMGREEDKQAFVGDVSGASDPFNGVYFASGVNSYSLVGGSVAYADLVNILMTLKAPYRMRGTFVLSTTALKQIMKLIDDNGRPIWSMPEAGAPGRILGRPYEESDQIPDTLGTTRSNGANTAILFGAFDGLWVSPRGGYTVKAGDQASNSSGKSAFTLDETWFKFRRRQSIDVINPEAFVKVAVPA